MIIQARGEVGLLWGWQREGSDWYPYFRYIWKVGPVDFLEKLVFD